MRSNKEKLTVGDSPDQNFIFCRLYKTYEGLKFLYCIEFQKKFLTYYNTVGVS